MKIFFEAFLRDKSKAINSSVMLYFYPWYFLMPVVYFFEGTKRKSECHVKVMWKSAKEGPETSKYGLVID